MESQSAIHEMLREARRRKGMTQAALADQVKCKQSAISMFEAGRPGALAREFVLKIARALDVDIKTDSEHGEDPGLPVETKLKYCPVGDCLSNIPYVAGGRLCFRPTLTESPVGIVARCRSCGEILEDQCPNEECRVDVVEGSFCPKCGVPYVFAALREQVDPVEWADEQRRRIGEVRAMSVTIRSREGGLK